MGFITTIKHRPTTTANGKTMKDMDMEFSAVSKSSMKDNGKMVIRKETDII